MKTVQKIADEAARWFRKDDQTDRFFLKDGAPCWIADLVHKAHGNYLPDDYRYRFTYEALDALSTCEDPGDVSMEPDVYTNQLTGWLHSNANRIYYLNAALQEFGPFNEGFDLLSAAQLLEKDEVLSIVRQYLEDGIEKAVI